MKPRIHKETYSSFLDKALKSKNKAAFPSSDNQSEHTKNFTQTSSLCEAKNFARHGWDAGIEELERDMKEVKIAGGSEINNSVIGAFPNVGEYLSGNPECMMQYTEEETRDMDRITIYASLSYTAGIDAEDVLEYTKKIVKVINELNKNNDVRLIGVFANQLHKTNSSEYLFVTIKDFEQNLILNNVAFSYHPSFFRRIWFRWLEGQDYYQSEYGKALHDNKTIPAIINNMDINKGDIFLPSMFTRGINWDIDDAVQLK